MAEIKKINTDLQLEGKLLDGNGSAGTSGQVLSSTGTATDWVSLSEISGVDGTGTANYIAKWSDGDTITNSVIYDNGTNVGIGTTSPNYKLSVNGNIESLDTFILNYANNGIKWQQLFDGANSWNLRYYNGTAWSGSAITVKADGNVGIGTTSPAAKLEVSGNIRVTNFLNDIEFGSSSNRLTYNQWLASASGGMGVRNTAGDIYFSTSSERMRITSAGNVGIGTTSPGAKLTVVDAGAIGNGLRVTGGGGGGAIATFVRDVGSTGITYVHSSGGNPQITFLNEGVSKTFSIGSNASSFRISDNSQTGTNDRFVIDSSGNVGIGTTSPQAKLHVAKNGNANGGSILMGLQGDGTSKWSYLAGTHYNQATTGSNGMAIIGGLSTATYNKVFIGGHPYEINPATQIEFWTHSATTHSLGGSQRGYVDSGGNWFLGDTLWVDAANDYVGIGTTSPSQKLDVVGNIYTSGAVRLKTTGAQLEFGNANVALQRTGNLLELGGYDGIVFKSSNAVLDSQTERMRITSSGNVGIGTTSPAAPLHVAPDSNYKVIKLGDDTVSHYNFTSQADHTLTLTCGSYYMAEVVITAAQSNSGGYNNLYIRGIWSNNHTTHHWDVLEEVGYMTANTISITNTENDVSNSGKLEIVHDYIEGGSFLGMTVRVTDYNGTHSYTIS